MNVFGRGDLIGVKYFASFCFIKHNTPTEHLPYQHHTVTSLKLVIHSMCNLAKMCYQIVL